MPLVIRSRTGLLGVAALSAALLAFAPSALAAPAPPAETAPPATCVEPDLTQPFLAWGDDRWYVPAPGQQADDFTAEGWTLTGGASVVQAPIADGSPHQVLDMPSGSTAVSPTMCVDSSYPIARTMVRNALGGDGVTFYVSYADTKSWDKPQKTGKVQGRKDAWTLSNPIDTHAGKAAGWQVVRFVLSAGGKKSDFQLYNLFVDPYRH